MFWKVLFYIALPANALVQALWSPREPHSHENFEVETQDAGSSVALEFSDVLEAHFWLHVSSASESHASIFFPVVYSFTSTQTAFSVKINSDLPRTIWLLAERHNGDCKELWKAPLNIEQAWSEPTIPMANFSLSSAACPQAIPFPNGLKRLGLLFSTAGERIPWYDTARGTVRLGAIFTASLPS